MERPKILLGIEGDTHGYADALTHAGFQPLDADPSAVAVADMAVIDCDLHRRRVDADAVARADAIQQLGAGEQLPDVGDAQGIGQVEDPVIGAQAKAGAGSIRTAPRKGEQVHGAEYTETE